MQHLSVNRRAIDWTVFRADVMRTAGSAQTIPDAFPAIRRALANLDDNHSRYVARNGTALSSSSIVCRASDPGVVSVPAGIGYVKVTTFAGGFDSVSTGFARSIQESIRAQDGAGIEGWVVDLRGNTGGNMWPMLAGVGPILGEGTAGYFIDPDGAEERWIYAAGVSKLDTITAIAVPAPYTLQRPNPPTAVLTDGRTTSSGEAIAVAFRGRPLTRSFGMPSCGLSTAIVDYGLSDGATLFLAVSYMADRAKNRFGVPISPDEEVSDPAQAVQRAVDWLRTVRKP